MPGTDVCYDGTALICYMALLGSGTDVCYAATRLGHRCTLRCYHVPELVVVRRYAMLLPCYSTQICYAATRQVASVPSRERSAESVALGLGQGELKGTLRRELNSNGRSPRTMCTGNALDLGRPVFQGMLVPLFLY